jgi:hypothetical protein
VDGTKVLPAGPVVAAVLVSKHIETELPTPTTIGWGKIKMACP